MSDSLAAGSRKKSCPTRIVGLLALDLAFRFFLAVAPVGMWKSGGVWTSRWAGVFLPVHRLVHALEPRSALQGRFPHIHGTQRERQDAAKKLSAMDGGLIYGNFAEFREKAENGKIRRVSRFSSAALRLPPPRSFAASRRSQAVFGLCWGLSSSGTVNTLKHLLSGYEAASTPP